MQNFGKSSQNLSAYVIRMRKVMANALRVQESFITKEVIAATVSADNTRPRNTMRGITTSNASTATPSKEVKEKSTKKKWTKDTGKILGRKWKSRHAKSVKEVNSKSKQ